MPFVGGRNGGDSPYTVVTLSIMVAVLSFYPIST